MRHWREIPTPGGQRSDFAVDADVEYSRLSGCDRGLKLRSKIRRLLHAFAHCAHRSRHLRVVGRKQLSVCIGKAYCQLAAFPEISRLLVADRAVAEIVPNKPNHRN